MKNQLKAGVILSYISTAVSIVIQLVYMPVMIRLLGQSEYGLYSLVSGVVSYLGLFSLGFSGAYMRFFAKSYGDKEKTARAAWISSGAGCAFVVYRFFCRSDHASLSPVQLPAHGAGQYKIADEIKARVDFHQHNLLKDTYPTDCNLIVCRNVLIYFTEEAKDEVFRKYYQSLAKGGMLFIGSTEQIMNYSEIGFDRKSSFYYVKPM